MYKYVVFAIRCNTLQHTATHCNTLQHTAPHCTTIHTVMRDGMNMTKATYICLHLYIFICTLSSPFAATHCNTLQHTASQYITVMRAGMNKTEESRE